MSETGNGVEYRFRKLEDAIATLTKRLDNIDEHGSRRVGVIETEVAHLRNDIAEVANEIRELRQELRDVRHRQNTLDASIGNLTRVVDDNVKTVESNSRKVDGLVKSIIVAVLGLGTVTVGSIVTMWLAIGGPP